MFRFIPVLFLLVAVCAASPSISPRIVGGADADIQNYPYTVSIERYGSHSCGGTILSADWVLTDAFCTPTPDVADFAVRAGSSIARLDSEEVVDTGTLYSVTEWIFHPQADYINGEYDFSLVKVNPPFEFNANVNAVKLPALDNQGTPVDAVGVVTGWGQTSQGGSFFPVSRLQYASVTLVGDGECTAAYNAQTICAKGVNGNEAICWFDEGGPLVVDDTLYGIVLWTQWCSNPQDLLRFSKLEVVRDWIDNTISTR